MGWLYGKLAGLGGKLLVALGAVGSIALIWFRGSYQRKRADVAERNVEASEANFKQYTDAEEAARIAGVEGQEEAHDAIEKAKHGDFSGWNKR